jgi:DNA-directed RNA polymerase sigma subunit (sigma70/sigma32)
MPNMLERAAPPRRMCPLRLGLSHATIRWTVPTADLFAEIQGASDLRQQIMASLTLLPFRHRAVVCARFGLCRHAPSTLDECGRLFFVTRESIRQTEHKALRFLGRHLGRIADTPQAV